MTDAQKLFDSLSAEAHKFAAVSTLGIEDVRQTLYLMCLERAAGKDKYNPLLGTERNYILGRMWGLVERWRAMQRLEGFQEDEDGADAALQSPSLRVPGADETLMEAHRRRVEEQIAEDLEREPAADMRTTVALVTHCGRPAGEFARIWGVNSSRLRRKAQKAISETRTREAPPSAIPSASVSGG